MMNWTAIDALRRDYASINYNHGYPGKRLLEVLPRDSDVDGASLPHPLAKSIE